MKLLVFVDKFDKEDDLLGFFVGWARELAWNLEKVFIVAQRVGKFENSPNLQVISLKKEKNKIPFFRLLKYFSVLFRFRKDYDVILVMMAPVWSIGSSLAAKILGKKSYLWYAVWRGSWRLKLAEKFADKIFCSVREAFPFRTKKLFLLGQGVDTDCFVPNEAIRQEHKLLFLGRISAVKKIEVLFHALAELRRINNLAFENLKLDIVGGTIFEKDDEYFAHLRNLAEELGLSTKINWVGRTPHTETVNFYQRSDIFINLTPTGSFDKTILEAMSCGDLILASNKALAHFLSDDVKDFVLFKENDPSDLARKLVGLFNVGLNEKQKMRHELREIIVKHHSQKQWAENLIKNMK